MCLLARWWYHMIVSRVRRTSTAPSRTVFTHHIFTLELHTYCYFPRSLSPVSILYKMRSPFTLLFASIYLLPHVSAELHSSGLSIDTVGGQNVYNDAATKAACAAYAGRNTGSEQWDTCPDCAMVSSPRRSMERRGNEVVGLELTLEANGWRPSFLQLARISYWGR
jgi:hypothetical protein